MLTPYGEMSHMGLLWRMVGASPLFERVGGWAEVILAFLLLSRCTSLPGALLSAGVMGFVFLLNISFDVWVKLFSGHLFVSSLLVLTPYLGNLSRLLQNQPTQPVSYPATPALVAVAGLAPQSCGAVLGGLAAPQSELDVSGQMDTRTSSFAARRAV
ncbi:hypothetical protein MF271_03265 [Deinococcus sp. KNUC1210]|uniref:hypothetical protein n=1 Tax=Deinococcus sp. KNUC1210 TaxID=2917691 RepID=UPI001EF01191|nr:hypothetical protein [Deinococcus sp. KNUC1210]ULH15674.1 hypothetical protein MF271_03265 [Deinococcus sp. KNUC1210]